MDILHKWSVDVLSDEDKTIGDKVLDLEKYNRIFISDLTTSFDEYAKEHNPKHRLWSIKIFCGQSRKIVSNVELKKRVRSLRECELSSLNQCRLFFADNYSLDTEIFNIK